MKNDPKRETGTPSCPTWLPAAAKREWRRLVQELKPLKLLAKVDRDGLADLALSVVRIRESELDITQRSLIVNGKRNPSILTSREYSSRLRAWAEKFGLSPADRLRLDVPSSEPKGKDPAEKYFKD